MSPSDYELIEQGYDPPVDPIAALYARVAKLEAALKELREYAASVWFDEASATDEEHELMRSSRAALKDAPQ